ncbi:hypothetical protein LSAT2_025373 [Lamellibrachia satsuma]|nr:hypothetical protein LSAT2_025373 [Lamellibrachia satsuma]
MGISCSELPKEKSGKLRQTKVAPSKKCKHGDSATSSKNPSIRLTGSNGSVFALSNRSSKEIWHGSSRTKRRVSATPTVNVICEEGDDDISKSSASGVLRMTTAAPTETMASDLRNDLAITS